MRVLITGGAGFLGSHLSDAFIARGDEVSVLDTGSIAKVRHLLDEPRFHYVHDSIFNLELIDGLVAKADLVYHLAAVVGVEHYVGDPYETLNVNVNGTQNILKAAYKYNKKVVFSSTSEVYGRNPKVPWKEDDDRVLGVNHDRSLVLFDLEGGRGAFLFCLPQAGHAGDGGALLQHLRAAAGPRRCGAAVHDFHGPAFARH